ncbi:hypothetical protein [Reinekea marinisedimentorum]|uniref:Uncharacterized protein n=1 Tax=Reinekea marinisedimentorum TaxID=230495 RepID=A0A4R3HY16_9GAMM|nr:hypothetical protein [Reinekea marinisedimentorum]TCS38078.1 hypothetical protein BCF53_1173 [Reinekea marinisedimentorum]
MIKLFKALAFVLFTTLLATSSIAIGKLEMPEGMRLHLDHYLNTGDLAYSYNWDGYPYRSERIQISTEKVKKMLDEAIAIYIENGHVKYNPCSNIYGYKYPAQNVKTVFYRLTETGFLIITANEGSELFEYIEGQLCEVPKQKS